MMKRNDLIRGLVLASSILLPALSPAQIPVQIKNEAARTPAAARPPVVEKVSRTEHSLTLDGQRIPYAATEATAK